MRTICMARAEAAGQPPVTVLFDTGGCLFAHTPKANAELQDLLARLAPVRDPRLPTARRSRGVPPARRPWGCT